MVIYVASHDPKAAIDMSEALMDAGHLVISSWPWESRDLSWTDGRYKILALRDVREVSLAEALVLIADKSYCPGGKFVEAGIAIGQGKPVYVVGHRENLLLWHPSVDLVNNQEELLQLLWQKPQDIS